jgi:hypothetical protein
LSSRSNHQSKSVAETGSWRSIFSEDLERLVELHDMFEEDESSQGLRLNISVESTNVSEDRNGFSQISESSVIESLGFTSDDAVGIACTTVVGWENQGFSNQERDKGDKRLLENSSLRGVVVENVECCLKSGFTRNWGACSTDGSCNITHLRDTHTHSLRVRIAELTISSLTSLDSSSKNILELVNLELGDLLDRLSNQPLNGSTAWRSSRRTNIGIETPRTSHGSVEITSCCWSEGTAGVEGTSGRTSSCGDIRVSGKSGITLFTVDRVDDSISTVGEFTVVSASGKRLSRCSIVAFLIMILKSVTTSGSSAVSFTLIGSVGIVGTKIAFFRTSNETISALKLASA